GATARERVLDLEAAAQAIDVLGAVAALDALPAGVIGPLLPDSLHFQISARHGVLLLVTGVRPHGFTAVQQTGIGMLASEPSQNAKAEKSGERPRKGRGKAGEGPAGPRK